MNLFFNNVLAVGAHPDDIEYSCLGFLLKQKKFGSKISVFVASHGSRKDATNGDQRIKESIESWKFNGFKFHQRNSGDFNYLEIENEIRKILVSDKFNCILVHDPNDTHQDHRLTYEIVLSAIRRLDISIIRYRSVSSTNLFLNNLVIDIGEFMDQKIKSLAFHASQKDKPYMSKKSIEEFHTLYRPGSKVEKFFETFYIESILG